MYYCYVMKAEPHTETLSRDEGKRLRGRGHIRKRVPHILYWACLVLIFLVVSTMSAFAGGYGTDQAVLDDMRYVEPEREMGMADDMDEAAQDITFIEPAAGEDRESAFQGFYVGGTAGYTISSTDIEDSAGPDGDVSLDGFEGGVFAGYSHVFERTRYPYFYTALEGGYEWSSAEGDLGTTTFDKSHEWLATVRAGILTGEQTALYAIAGYSRAEFAVDTGAEDDLDGFVLGAGVEYSFNMPFASLRGEYIYTDYEDETLNGFGFDDRESEIKVGLVLRF